MALIRNIHERTLPVPAAEVGALLDRLGSSEDRLWPAPAWPPVRFDRPLAVGADGGHGPIRYWVSRYEPGRLVELTFREETGVRGTHSLDVRPIDDASCVLRHRVVGQSFGSMRLLWPAVVRICHDTCVEHLLDNAERVVTGSVARPVAYPWRARLAVAAGGARVRPVPVPGRARLLHDWAAARDLEDAYAVRVPPGTTTDPQTWTDAVFRDPPRVVVLLLHLRNALAPLVGVEPADSSAFATVGRSADEVLLGADEAPPRLPGERPRRAGRPRHDRHRVDGCGGAFPRRPLLPRVVRLVHPVVLRSMLRRAARKAVAPPRAGHHPAQSSGASTGLPGARATTMTSPARMSASPT
jgi:hypothetical protein